MGKGAFWGVGIFCFESPLIIKEPGDMGMGQFRQQASISKGVDGKCACIRSGRVQRAGFDGESWQ